MRIRWSPEAADDFANITEYLLERTPQHATRLVRSLYEAVNSLKIYPARGRSGKRAGTRELVISSLPYLVVYREAEGFIYIVRILHGAQKWPV